LSSSGCHVDGAHRLVDQRRDRFEHVQFVDLLVGANSSGIFDGEPADEHRQPIEHDLLTLVEQVIGPIERRNHRLMASGTRPPPTRQQPQAFTQARLHASGAEGSRPGRGELDRQRHPVQLATDVEDHRPVVAAADRSALCDQPVREQRHRTGVRRIVLVVGRQRAQSSVAATTVFSACRIDAAD